MRVLGLDYGTKTVGVALSDELGITAQPFDTICRDRENKLRQTDVYKRQIHTCIKLIGSGKYRTSFS